MSISKLRRTTLSAAALLTVTLAATSCGLGGGSATQSSGAANEAPKPQVDCEVPAENLTSDKVDTSKAEGTIRFATQGLKKDFGGFFNPLIAQFEKEHPGAKIEWEDTPSAEDFDARMVTDAQTCVMADVINVPSTAIGALTQGNLLINFDNKMPDVGKRFIPGLWDGAGIGPNGAHTALPWYWSPSVVTFNKDLMTEGGLDPKTPPTTVPELQEQALKAAEKSDGKVQSLWGNTKWTFLDQWFNSGVAVMNEDKTEFTFADDPKAVEWLANMAKIYAAGGISKDSVTGKPDPGQAFNEGNLVFGSPNASFLRNVKNNAPALYPHTGVSGTLSSEGAGTNFDGQFISVSVTTKNLPLAAAWADYVTNAENQLAWDKDPNVVIFPTAAKALEDPFFTKQDTSDLLGLARSVAAKSAKDAVLHPETFLVTGKVLTRMLQEIQLATTGAKSPEDALKQAQDDANKLLASTRP